MLNENYPYYNHPDFEAASPQEYSYFDEADKTEYAKLELDFTQYQTLKTRVIDLMQGGYTLTRLAIDTGPTQVNYRSVGQGQWDNTLKKWLESFKNLRKDSRYSDQPSTAEVVETALMQLFETLDKENSNKSISPVFVMTSVSQAIIQGFDSARKMQEVVEIKAPAGSGKTYTMQHYMALCRKSEGFNCPIWIITLRESNNSLKHILYEIALAMRGQAAQSFNNNGLSTSESDYHLSNEIERYAAEQRGGLLIIEEAQNLFNGLKGATVHHGLGIVNELRSFTDKHLMGIALLSNGEIYKRAEQNNATQLARRLEFWRVDAGKPTNEDVELIMQAWGVAGKPAREWSISVGTGKGGLGSLTAAYQASIKKYGEISYTTLMSFRKV